MVKKGFCFVFFFYRDTYLKFNNIHSDRVIKGYMSRQWNSITFELSET